MSQNVSWERRKACYKRELAIQPVSDIRTHTTRRPVLKARVQTTTAKKLSENRILAKAFVLHQQKLWKKVKFVLSRFGQSRFSGPTCCGRTNSHHETTCPAALTPRSVLPATVAFALCLEIIPSSSVPFRPPYLSRTERRARSSELRE